jgi:hypothetical protein
VLWGSIRLGLSGRPHGGEHGGPKLGGGFRDGDASILESIDLGGGSSLAAGDDGTSMTCGDTKSDKH